MGLAGDAVAVAVHLFGIAGLAGVERRPATAARTSLQPDGGDDVLLVGEQCFRSVVSLLRPFLIEHGRTLFGRCGKPLDSPAGRRRLVHRRRRKRRPGVAAWAKPSGIAQAHSRITLRSMAHAIARRWLPRGKVVSREDALPSTGAPSRTELSCVHLQFRPVDRHRVWVACSIQTNRTSCGSSAGHCAVYSRCSTSLRLGGARSIQANRTSAIPLPALGGLAECSRMFAVTSVI